MIDRVPGADATPRRTKTNRMWVSGYLVVTVAALVALPDRPFALQIAKSALAAQLFFLVPCGVGLFAFHACAGVSRLRNYLTTGQIVVAATFWGLTFQALAYSEANIHGYLFGSRQFVNFTYIVTLAVAMAGLHFLDDIIDYRKLWDSAPRLPANLPLLAIFGTTYYVYFFVFSRYPRTDIFQDVHFLEGALGFSQFQFLNVLLGDSYIPNLQVQWGLLNSVFTTDLILLRWTLPIASFFFGVVCIWTLFSSLKLPRFTVALGVAFAAIALKLINYQNHDLLVVYTLAYWGVVLRTVSQYKTNTQLLVVTAALAGAFAFLFVNRNMPALEHSYLPWFLLCTLFLILARVTRNATVVTAGLLLALLAPCPVFNRGSALFQPAVLLMGCIYVVLARFRVLLAGARFSRRVLGFSIATVSVIAATIAVLAVFPSGLPAASRIVNLMFLSVVAQDMSRNIGILPVLVEMFRAVSPLMVLTAIGLILWMLGSSRSLAGNPDTLVATWYFLFGVVLFGLFLIIPLPSNQRIVPLFAVCITGLIAVGINAVCDHPNVNTRIVKVLLFSIVAYTVLSQKLYEIPPSSKFLKVTPYLSLVSGVHLAAVVTVVVGAMVIWLVPRHRIVQVMLPVVLATSFLNDHFLFIARFMERSFGQELPADHVVSHYTTVELEAAESLRTLFPSYLKDPPYILISDPKTLGIFSATTGMTGFLGFSNLGLFDNEALVEAYRKVLRTAFLADGLEQQDVLEGSHERAIGDAPCDCREARDRLVREVARFFDDYPGGIAKASFTINQRFRKRFDDDFIRRRLVWVVSQNTIEWALGGNTYFSSMGRFRHSYIQSHIAPCFRIIENKNDQLLILKLDLSSNEIAHEQILVQELKRRAKCPGSSQLPVRIDQNAVVF